MNCLSICFKDLGCQLNPLLMKSEHKMLNHREGKSISATTVEKMGMVCISALTQEDILEMDKEEVLEDKLLHLETGPKHLLINPSHQLLSLKY